MCTHENHKAKALQIHSIIKKNPQLKISYTLHCFNNYDRQLNVLFAP